MISSDSANPTTQMEIHNSNHRNRLSGRSCVRSECWMCRALIPHLYSNLVLRGLKSTRCRDNVGLHDTRRLAANRLSAMFFE